MRTTIHLSGSTRAVVAPRPLGGGVSLEFKTTENGITSSEAYHLTADQWGALMFGGEMAFEAIEVTNKLAIQAMRAKAAA